MKDIPLPTDKKEIDSWQLRQFCFDLLDQDLVPSDSHDEEGAMMTEDEWHKNAIAQLAKEKKELTGK